MKTLPIATFAALALLASVPLAAQKLRMGTLAPKDSPWYDILRDMGEDWKKASDGKVKLKIYAGTVGDDPDMVRRMRIRQLNAAALTATGLAAIVPEIEVFQLPRLLTTYGELDYVLEKMGPELEAKLEAKGFKLLNWADAGWVHFFAAEPVVSLADLRKQKLLVWAGGSKEIEAWKDAGCHPVPLPSSEIHTGLNSGLINAFATTPVVALSFQWFGLAKNMADMRWGPLIGGTIIRKQDWDRLPADAKDELEAAAAKAGRRFKKEVRTKDEEAIAAMEKYGLVVHKVPQEEIEIWQREAEAVYGRILGDDVDPALLERVKKLRDEYRAAQAAKAPKD